MKNPHKPTHNDPPKTPKTDMDDWLRKAVRKKRGVQEPKQ